MLQSKWIKFIEIKTEKKTKTFEIWTADRNSILLGHVKWFVRWRKYAFFPDGYTVFEQDCLNDIKDFLIRLMDDRRTMKIKEWSKHHNSKKVDGVFYG
ncbi:MAG: hypothetical protein PHY56_00185 [Candidatus Omnitrophica bacterium]|nr:hypothetical protein [Candidatus Omnitrophota bacterium]